jgi:hypothetical protein
MPNILITSEVTVDQIVHDKKKARGKGAHQNCRISYGNNKDFVIQGPKMRVPFGVSEPKPEYNPTGLDKFSFELSLQTDEKYDTKGQVAAFKHLLEDMDDSNCEYIASCSKEWWPNKKEKDADAVKENNYHSMIKKDVSGKETTYPDRFKIKLPFYRGIPQFKVYNSKKEEIIFCKEVKVNGKDTPVVDWSWATKGMEIVPIMQCDGLWIVQDKVYCNWKAVGVKVYESASTKVDADTFRDMGDSEDEDEGDTGVEEQFAKADIGDDVPLANVIDEAEVSEEEGEDPEAEVSDEESDDE